MGTSNFISSDPLVIPLCLAGFSMALVWLTRQKEGRKIAHSRRAELREIALNAKAEMREEQSMQAAHDAEEMRKMLEGLAIQQSKEEEEARRVFKEREKRLWAVSSIHVT